MTWIYDMLPKVLSMSVTASAVICGVFLIRMLLRKTPKIFSYVLWSVVLFRLLCPVTISSSFVGLQIWTQDAMQAESGENFSKEIQTSNVLEDTKSQMLDNKAEVKQYSTVISEQAVKETVMKAYNTISGKELAGRISTWIWFIGMIGMAANSIRSSLKLRKKLVGSICLKDNIYICDYIDTPFAMGIVAPKIYLPSFLSEREKQFIILHEQTHIHRGDHIAKLLAFVALTIHWFNPFVWAAFHFAGKDMEMACDETVMRKIKRDIRVEYSNSLLCLATGKNIIGGSALAFGEGDTKGRIKNVMQYKKPSSTVICMAILVVLVCLLVLGINHTTPKESDSISLGDGKNTEQDAKAYEEFVNAWAKSFCERDSETIVQYSSNEICETLKDASLLKEVNGAYTFGQASPWPQNTEADYRIISMTDTEAVILYYAWNEEPHVWVWEETITYEKTESSYQIVGEQLNTYDNISTGTEFECAYPTGINHTPMDYLQSRSVEWKAIQNNIKKTAAAYMPENAADDLSFRAALSSSWLYPTLSDPKTAAVYLLNMNEEAVTVTAREVQDDGAVLVDLEFADGYSVTIKMVQPFSDNGNTVWIPQDCETKK